MTHKAYALKYNNKNVLKNSSSGGAFTLMSDYVLQHNGFVYGAVYNYSENNVIHMGSNRFAVRNQMRGSKYIQSKMCEVYYDVGVKLVSGEIVLFTGTICQIEGLKNYLSAKNIQIKKLFCCDIICHGVASPKIWTDYINWKTVSNGIDHITEVSFRDKSNGWTSSYTIAKSGNKIVKLPEFMKLYYSHTIIRESCHSCPFTNTERVSDITIGDFWGIEKAIPDFDYVNGTSFVMINSDRGSKLFNDAISLSTEIIYRECNVEDVNQVNFSLPAPKSIIRERVWQEYRTKGISFIINKYTSDKSLSRLSVLFYKVIDTIKFRLQFTYKYYVKKNEEP